MPAASEWLQSTRPLATWSGNQRVWDGTHHPEAASPHIQVQNQLSKEVGVRVVVRERLALVQDLAEQRRRCWCLPRPGSSSRLPTRRRADRLSGACMGRHVRCRPCRACSRPAHCGPSACLALSPLAPHLSHAAIVTFFTQRMRSDRSNGATGRLAPCARVADTHSCAPLRPRHGRPVAHHRVADAQQPPRPHRRLLPVWRRWRPGRGPRRLPARQRLLPLRAAARDHTPSIPGECAWSEWACIRGGGRRCPCRQQRGISATAQLTHRAPCSLPPRKCVLPQPCALPPACLVRLCGARRGVASVAL